MGTLEKMGYTHKCMLCTTERKCTIVLTVVMCIHRATPRLISYTSVTVSLMMHGIVSGDYLLPEKFTLT